MPASAGSIPAGGNAPDRASSVTREPGGEEQDECLDLVGVLAARVPYGWAGGHPELCRATAPVVRQSWVAASEPVSAFLRGFPDDVGLSRHRAGSDGECRNSGRAAREGRVLGGCDTMRRIEELLTRSRP
jgi:hypothetical protein